MGGGVVDDVVALEGGGVGFGFELERVATVGEGGGAIGEDRGKAGAPGETGEPGEAFGAGGNIFAEVLVGAGNDEAVQPGAPDRGA